MSEAGNLKLNHLFKSFRVNEAELPVLKDINLSVKPGEFISIVGSSGCGKSTLLRLIVGLENDYQGELLLNEVPIVGTSLDRGIVFQEHRLFPWLTVEKNIGLGLINSKISQLEKDKIVHEHIALVGLVGFEAAYPHQLSGGMSQRVAIARALVNRPKILLLDEPFGALDALTRAHLQQELHNIWEKEGITMILVTHDVEEAIFLGDRVVVMEPRPGRIKKIIDVNLDHPRNRNSLAFAHLREQVLAEFGEDALGSDSAPGSSPAESSLDLWRFSW